MAMAVRRIAADVGGTFTDIACLDSDGALATCKVPSSPANFADAVTDGTVRLLGELGSPPAALAALLHGSTVATNLILEHKGAKTALITTLGFRDVLELRRIRVPSLYEPLYIKPVPLVPRYLRLEVDERVAADGSVLRKLALADVYRALEVLVRHRIEAVAVAFLHSYANSAHEHAVGEILAQELPGCFVSLSAEVLPQKREYERTSTTVINSYIGPPVRRYVGAMVDQMRTVGIGGRLMMMQSDGGIIDAASVAGAPARITECGPAAGVIGAEHFGRRNGYPDLITLDMGGTTAKASIVEGGAINYADEYEVGGNFSSRSFLAGGGGYALKLPVVDVLEIGAGGGSIAWLDKGGSLKIGPRSAGAVPGPACYGKGNTEATVTDANVVLGYLNPKALAGGSVPIDAERSRVALAKIAKALSCDLLQAAYGVHAVANANMMRVVKAVTTYRGRDPRDFTLFAYGGNGGVHAVDLARVLQIRRVVVPPGAGVFSAIGLLFSRQRSTWTQPLHCIADDFPSAEATAKFATMAARIESVLGVAAGAIEYRYEADVRFVGQAFEITVPFAAPPIDRAALARLHEAFAAEHMARYGHAFAGRFPIEIVNLRLTGTLIEDDPPDLTLRTQERRPAARRLVHFGPGHGTVDTAILGRQALADRLISGPMVIEEYEGTVVVPPDCGARRDSYGNIVIELPGAAPKEMAE
jgi:N-methylhydantoinase A